nr:hypothetical protein [Tanacetum cinerariifolium]
MPVIPSVSNEAMRTGGPAILDGQLNAEEEEAAEENMKVYLKPVNYYSMLKVRAKVKPLFLARSLSYKLQEKHTKKNMIITFSILKVQLSVSISEAIGKTIFPVYILLARKDPTPNRETLRSSSYQFKKAIKLTASDGTQAKFTLPEIKKLSAEVKDRSFSLLLVSGADHTNPNEMDRTKNHMLTLCNMGDCVMGKFLIDNLLQLSFGEKLQSRSTVSMQSCRMKFQEDEKYKVVNVSYNKIDAFSPQIFGILAGEEKKMFFCHKALPRTKIDEDETQLAHHLGHVTFG